MWDIPPHRCSEDSCRRSSRFMPNICEAKRQLSFEILVFQMSCTLAVARENTLSLKTTKQQHSVRCPVQQVQLSQYKLYNAHVGILLITFSLLPCAREVSHAPDWGTMYSLSLMEKRREDVWTCAKHPQYMKLRWDCRMHKSLSFFSMENLKPCDRGAQDDFCKVCLHA